MSKEAGEGNKSIGIQAIGEGIEGAGQGNW